MIALDRIRLIGRLSNFFWRVKGKENGKTENVALDGFYGSFFGGGINHVAGA